MKTYKQFLESNSIEIRRDAANKEQSDKYLEDRTRQAELSAASAENFNQAEAERQEESEEAAAQRRKAAAQRREAAAQRREEESQKREESHRKAPPEKTVIVIKKPKKRNTGKKLK